MAQDPLTTIFFFVIFGIFGLWFAFQSQQGEAPAKSTSFLDTILGLFSRRYTSSDEKSPSGIVFGVIMFIVSVIMIARQLM